MDQIASPKTTKKDKPGKPFFSDNINLTGLDLSQENEFLSEPLRSYS
jgi:hypothetical protein